MQRRQFVAAGTAASIAWPTLVRAASSKNLVRISQSVSLSGAQSRYGKDVNLGLSAALNAANKAEGSGGLRFELTALDDGGVKDRTVENTKKLIEGGAAALAGYTSGAGAEACLPLIQQSPIALIGTASGNMGIRSGSQPGTVHVRAGYDVEYRRVIGYVNTFGFHRVGYVYLQDTSKANLAAMSRALEEVKLQPALSIGVDRNAKDWKPVADQLMAAKLDCVVFTTNAAPVLALTRLMGDAGYQGMYFASSFAGQDLIDGVPQAGRSVVMSLVVPRPTALGVGVVAQCGRDLAALGGDAKLGVTVLEGYIAGRVAVEAARQAAQRGGEANRQRILEAFANLKVDLGGYRVAFEGGNSQGSQYVDLVVIDRFGRIAG